MAQSMPNTRCIQARPLKNALDWSERASSLEDARIAEHKPGSAELPVALYVALDLVGGLAAALVAFPSVRSDPLRLAGVGAGVLIALLLHHAYDRSYLLSGGTEYTKIFNGACTALLGLLLAATIVNADIAPSQWAAFGIVCPALLGFGRFGVRRYVYWQRKRGKFLQPTLVVGANQEGVAVASQLGKSRTSGARVAGFIDDWLPLGEEPIAGIPVVGRAADIERNIEERGIKSVVVADNRLLSQMLADQHLLMDLLAKVSLSVVWGGFDAMTAGLKLKEEGFVPLLEITPNRISGVHAIFKSILDTVGAALIVLLLSPIFLLLSIIVAVDSRGPIIHRRRVVGQGGKVFDAFKFRTMYKDADTRITEAQKQEWKDHGKVKDDPRITRAGAWLRRFSLDELPQLFNVLLGQMSLVGPRMVTEPEMEKFGRWQLSRMTVRPGLTGLWQVAGRSDLSYEERTKLDIEYIRNYSIWLDLSILFRTIPALLFGRGAY